MKSGGYGGEHTKSGLVFEEKVDLISQIKEIRGYSIKKRKNKAGFDILFRGNMVAHCFKKHEFYKFLKEKGVEWRKIISTKILPDDALLVIVRETLFIIEVKYQNTHGSVDEKLQTCDFKRKQYSKLVQQLGLKVEFVYVLNEWFKHPRYKDTLDYITSVNCHYRFGSIPLSWLGLPH